MSKSEVNFIVGKCNTVLEPLSPSPQNIKLMADNIS